LQKAADNLGCNRDIIGMILEKGATTNIPTKALVEAAKIETRECNTLDT
jgi:hypothetical protein